MKPVRGVVNALAVVLLIGLAVVATTSVLNRNRLASLEERFCSIDLPPGSERRQCHGLVGTIAVGSATEKRCDYLVWMKVYSDTTPDELTEWVGERGVLSTDGETTMLPEVFVSHAGIEPAGHRYRYHVQVIDAGHPPGLDIQCLFGV